MFLSYHIEGHKWDTYGGIREVLLKLFHIDGFLNGKYNEDNQSYTLLDYLPFFYNWQQLTHQRNKGNVRENIKNFHCAYTYTLWNFRKKNTEGKAKEDEFFSTKLLYNKMTIYLKALKDMDRGLCKEVINYIETRMGDSKLTEVIKARVNTDSKITKIYKMFKGFRRPKK